MENQSDLNELRRTLEIIPSQKFLMGVCAAFSNYLRINVFFVRLIVLLAFIFMGQSIILIYSAFGILLPVNDTLTIESENLSNKLFLNFLFIAALIFLILIQTNYLTIKEIFNFIKEKTDSFSILIFSIALVINGYNKEGIEMGKLNYKRLTLSDKKVIFGVCGGLAEYLNLPPNLIRIIWVIFAIASLGTAIFIYIILRFIIPSKANLYEYDDK